MSTFDLFREVSYEIKHRPNSQTEFYKHSTVDRQIEAITRCVKRVTTWYSWNSGDFEGAFYECMNEICKEGVFMPGSSAFEEYYVG